MNTSIWQEWKSNWEWILNIAKKRNWEIINDLSIKPVVNLNEVNSLIQKLNIQLPKDFIEVITNYSREVSFYLSIEGEEPEGEFRQIFSAGYESIWSFDDLDNLKEQYDDWVKECFLDPSDEYNKIWHNKTPIIRVATGDLIAFDIIENSGSYPVIFLSHDGSDFHGKRLGNNFVDFISRWSNIGCFGPEDWQLEPFHNPEKDILEFEGEKIEKWKEWLNK